ncbi:hypothetical protein CSHISOI_00372, partial [Colletotrichum shisoi]
IWTDGVSQRLHVTQCCNPVSNITKGFASEKAHHLRPRDNAYSFRPSGIECMQGYIPLVRMTEHVCSSIPRNMIQKTLLALEAKGRSRQTPSEMTIRVLSIYISVLQYRLADGRLSCDLSHVFSTVSCHYRLHNLRKSPSFGNTAPLASRCSFSWLFSLSEASSSPRQRC